MEGHEVANAIENLIRSYLNDDGYEVEAYNALLRALRDVGNATEVLNPVADPAKN
jgi:hypothetical protein